MKENSGIRIRIVRMAEDSSWQKQMSQRAFCVSWILIQRQRCPLSYLIWFWLAYPDTEKCLTCLNTANKGTSKHRPRTSSSCYNHSDPPSLAKDDWHPSGASCMDSRPHFPAFLYLDEEPSFSTSPFIGYKTEENTGRFRTNRENGKLQKWNAFHQLLGWFLTLMWFVSE